MSQTYKLLIAFSGQRRGRQHVVSDVVVWTAESFHALQLFEFWVLRNEKVNTLITRRRRGEQHVASAVVVWTAELSSAIHLTVFGGRAYRGRGGEKNILVLSLSLNSGNLHGYLLYPFRYFEQRV